MDKTKGIDMLLKKVCPLLLLFLCLAASAQPRYRWTPVPVDSMYSEIKDSTATMIIRKFDPMLSSLYEVIGTSDAEYTANRPESGFSNFVADLIRERAEKECGRRVHLAMTNFGGIRTSLPKGDITVYDIMSIFPFTNRIEVFEMKGDALLRFFERHAGNPEALSGVRMEVADGAVKSLEVDGAPVDPGKTYTFASIDFLIKGGDGIRLEGMENLVDTGVLIRTAVEDHIRKMTSEGKTVSLAGDGRTIITNTKKDRK